MFSKKVLAEKYQSVHEQLIALYGEPNWRRHLPPLDELVSTILSQNTSDTNRDRAFKALKESFPDWESVMFAQESEVRDLIRPAGLSNQKAPRIQEALRRVHEEAGELNLDFLEDLSLRDAKSWLVRIKGIGPKTAAILLLFAYGRPALPVDTHVHRVTRRLGLIGPKVTADKAHVLLENIGQPHTYYAFHLNVIRHGREICSAKRPKCSQCPLWNQCDYYSDMVAS